MNTKIDRCDNCNYFTEVTEYKDWSQSIVLCAVCSSTFLSRATDSKRMSDGEMHLAKSLGFLFNALIDALDVRDEFNDILKGQEEFDEGKE